MAHFKTQGTVGEISYPPEKNYKQTNHPEKTEPKFEQFVSSLESLGKMRVVPRQEEITRLFIKNMVSYRCIIVVKAILENSGFYCHKVELGEAQVLGKISEEQREKLRTIFLKSELELIGNKRDELVEKIKNALVEMIHYSDEIPKVKISHYLSEKLKYDYTYLANVFSEVTASSIRQFVIKHKIERVKKMLLYEDLTLSQIAFKLQYSSVAYLSRQFKKHVGQIPSHFKKLKSSKLIALENV